MVVAGVVAIIVWGALAFGAVYPWAYAPLLIACAMIGALGLFRSRSPRKLNRAAVAAAMSLLAAVIVQVVPLPVSLLQTVSPATDAFLRNHDLSYAFGASRHPLSIDPPATMLGVTFLAAFLIFLAGLVAEFSRSGARHITAAIVVFGVVLSLIGIVQKAALGDALGMKVYGFWTPQHHLVTPFGPFVNKNHFAGWMLMALPLALGLALGTAERSRHAAGGWRSVILWFSSPDGGRLQLLVLAVAVMAGSLLMTKSRSGLGCLVIALVLASIAVVRRFGSARARWVTVGATALLFALVFAWAGGDIADRIINRTDAMQLRKHIWKDSVAIIRDFPLAGTGLNTFGTAMLTYQTSHRTSDRGLHFQEAHNDYLQTVVEGGLLVGIPAFAALVLVIRTIRRRFISRRDDGMTYWLRVGATTGLAAIAVQSLVEFSLQMPGNAALCVVLLAIAMHEPRTRSIRPATGSAAHP